MLFIAGPQRSQLNLPSPGQRLLLPEALPNSDSISYSFLCSPTVVVVVYISFSAVILFCLVLMKILSTNL